MALWEDTTCGMQEEGLGRKRATALKEGEGCNSAVLENIKEWRRKHSERRAEIRKREWTGIYIEGSEIRLHQRYRLREISSGTTETGDWGLCLASMLPSSCQLAPAWGLGDRGREAKAGIQQGSLHTRQGYPGRRARAAAPRCPSGTCCHVHGRPCPARHTASSAALPAPQPKHRQKPYLHAPVPAGTKPICTSKMQKS